MSMWGRGVLTEPLWWHSCSWRTNPAALCSSHHCSFSAHPWLFSGTAVTFLQRKPAARVCLNLWGQTESPEGVVLQGTVLWCSQMCQSHKAVLGFDCAQHSHGTGFSVEDKYRSASANGKKCSNEATISGSVLLFCLLIPEQENRLFKFAQVKCKCADPSMQKRSHYNKYA